jgi:hypothetical protein
VALTAQEAATIKEGFKSIIDALEKRREVDLTQYGELRGQLAAFDKLVRGDGTDGLSGRVTLLQERQEQLLTALDEVKKKYDKLVWWIISVLATSLGGMVMTFVVGRLSK